MNGGVLQIYEVRAFKLHKVYTLIQKNSKTRYEYISPVCSLSLYIHFCLHICTYYILTWIRAKDFLFLFKTIYIWKTRRRKKTYSILSSTLLLLLVGIVKRSHSLFSLYSLFCFSHILYEMRILISVLYFLRQVCAVVCIIVFAVYSSLQESIIALRPSTMHSCHTM